MSKIELYQKLIKEGFSLSTVLKFDKYQMTYLLNQLNENEALSKLTQDKAQILATSEKNREELESINTKINDTAEKEGTDAIDISEEDMEDLTGENEEIDPRFHEPSKYKDAGGQEKEVLEVTMDGFQGYGYPDTDGASTYNFKSKGPLGSEPELEDEGFETFYGDSDSQWKAYNFDGAGPLYGSDIYPDVQLSENKFPALQEVMGGNYDLKEDPSNQWFSANQEKIATGQGGQFSPHDADDAPDDGMDDDTNPHSAAHKYEGDIAEELLEKFVSQKQSNYFFAKCKEEGPKSKWCGMAKEFADDTNYDTLKENGGLNEWVMKLVEKNILPSMTKKELLQTINEYGPGMPATTPGTTPTITPTKTPSPTKPGRKTPYQPKHKPKPKAKVKDDTEEIFPSLLQFDSLFRR